MRPTSDSAASPDWNALGEQWWSHVRALAGERMEGRETGSPGMVRAAEYVTEQFRAAGLRPSGTEGYLQPVEFRVAQVDQPSSTLELVRDGRSEAVTLGEDAVLSVYSTTAEHAEADAVFVGYGLTIPEFQHDDFAGVDVRGKIVVLVRGGPSTIPGPVRAHYQSPEERFRAVRRAGAVGAVLIVNPTVPELPWSRLAEGFLLPRMELVDPGTDGPEAPPTIAVFNPDRAEKMFAGSGHTFREIVGLLGSEAALPRFPLAVRLRVHAAFERRRATCRNVVGLLPGSDPHLRNEYVVLSAHLDHLGTGGPGNGHPIYWGAMDNASGVASLLEVARAFHDSGIAPKRSILFLAVTGEEKGLLGSQYFATHPSVTGTVVANVNLDMFLPLFPLKYVEVQGLLESTLGDEFRAVCAPGGIVAHTEYEPDRVLFIRSDQYNFIKAGVPALTFSFGYLPGSAEETTTKTWLAERYHGPADRPDQPVDAPAAAQFNEIIGTMALRVANADRRPEWNADSFFRRFAR